MSIEDRVRKVVSEQLDVSGDIDNNASFIHVMLVCLTNVAKKLFNRVFMVDLISILYKKGAL